MAFDRVWHKRLLSTSTKNICITGDLYCWLETHLVNKVLHLAVSLQLFVMVP